MRPSRLEMCAELRRRSRCRTDAEPMQSPLPPRKGRRASDALVMEATKPRCPHIEEEVLLRSLRYSGGAASHREEEEEGAEGSGEREGRVGCSLLRKTVMIKTLRA
ncbi:hypothetical protein CRENBAI_010276 [Crenichthys baileyi]|uniref:Uncharacterized protein n=1 Tax=Crenichthys baileyi TaxID=28760 RepID=A0AAV9RC59_9TELE